MTKGRLWVRGRGQEEDQQAIVTADSDQSCEPRVAKSLLRVNPWRAAKT